MQCILFQWYRVSGMEVQLEVAVQTTFGQLRGTRQAR
jgi:hypothetical protein